MCEEVVNTVVSSVSRGVSECIDGVTLILFFLKFLSCALHAVFSLVSAYVHSVELKMYNKLFQICRYMKIVSVNMSCFPIKRFISF